MTECFPSSHMGADPCMCTEHGLHQEPLTDSVTLKPAMALYQKRMNNCELVDDIRVSG